MIHSLNSEQIEKARRSVESCGFTLLDALFDPSLLKDLQEEAAERRNAALFAEQSAGLAYRANITSLGPRASEFLASRPMTQLLSAIFGGDFELTANRSCLTYYREGDHLGPHLDQPAEECEVTIIVYVLATGPAHRAPLTGPPQTGLELRIYGEQMTEEPRLTIPTRTGGIVLGRGSKFWHERPMLQKNEQVVALTGCYKYAAADLVNTPISLDPSFAAAHGHAATEAELRRIVCSVRFELAEGARAFRLLGPEMSYHLVDPHLPEALGRFEAGLTLADIPAYSSSRKYFDLYFEDSWSGYFIARRFEQRHADGDLLLIHLDDHTDMMATLLSESNGSLTDPTSGAAFEPRSSNNWKAAIDSGAVNIGNFITPLFYSGRNIHVRHIRSASHEPEEVCHVFRAPCRYDLIPGKRFAAISKSKTLRRDSVGTYRAGPDPETLLDGVPSTWTIVHIDLDYFINDFNGATRGEDYTPDPILRTQAEAKMNRFFQALGSLNPTIDRWLIATSPGFCSGYHWRWLLSSLENRIQAFHAPSAHRVQPRSRAMQTPRDPIQSERP